MIVLVITSAGSGNMSAMIRVLRQSPARISKVFSKSLRPFGGKRAFIFDCFDHRACGCRLRIWLFWSRYSCFGRCGGHGHDWIDRAGGQLHDHHCHSDWWGGGNRNVGGWHEHKRRNEHDSFSGGK